MAFQIGQRVVCIDNRFALFYGDELLPRIGQILTIRELQTHNPLILGLIFEEVRNPKLYYPAGFMECSFDARGFRPVVDTDISIFTAMLNPEKELEPAK